MSNYVPPFEYQSASCDVWQVAHLCNHMAGYGWEPVSVADGHYEGAQVTERASDENGKLVTALKKMVVLFRRPTGWGADDEANDAEVAR